MVPRMAKIELIYVSGDIKAGVDKCLEIEKILKSNDSLSISRNEFSLLFLISMIEAMMCENRDKEWQFQ